jgi:hypothetical protein
MNGREVAVVMRERRLGDPAILVADPTNFQTRLGFKASGSDLRRIISTAGPGIRELILDRSAPEDAKDPRRFIRINAWILKIQHSPHGACTVRKSKLAHMITVR